MCVRKRDVFSSCVFERERGGGRGGGREGGGYSIRGILFPLEKQKGDRSRTVEGARVGEVLLVLVLVSAGGRLLLVLLVF